MSQSRLFCFGLGFSAAAVTRRMLREDWWVAGSRRDAAGCAWIAALGAEAYRFNESHALDAAALAGTTHLLTSIAPRADGDVVLASQAETIAALESLEWIGYISSTAVYGDRRGGLAAESDAVAPVSGRGCRRASAEAAWLALGEGAGKPVQIFRAAGIYGPGRSALDQIVNGKLRRIDKPGQKFSRIHVDDLAEAVAASMAAPQAGAIYNLCDDEPASNAEVLAHACTLLGREPPPLVPYAEAEAGMSAMARELWSDSRRIDNRRMHEVLGVALSYPSYREGLAAILAT
ncbi:MAG: SDR family NAD(P)-dependent oxidoreductase [Alphaproteobacteria bacterium]|nr:SDR family NAD(P)-dependent oxidoreductase [Alphaproteobacteria bacterium]